MDREAAVTARPVTAAGPTRRAAVFGAGLAGLAAIPAPPDSLRAAAASRGRVFGSEVLQAELTGTPSYAALIAAQCGAITPGLEAKWSWLRPAPDRFNFTALDWLASYAAGHAMKLRLHTLLWGPELPAWAKQAIAEGQAEAILTQHIRTVVPRYRGRAFCWDVANEVSDPRWSRGPEGLTYTPWRKALGPDVVPLAFHLAHDADPTALLFLNDDTLEYQGPAQDEKRATYLRLIATWKSQGVPIHGFGLQAHLDPQRPFAPAAYRRFLADLAGMGLVLHITELDVHDRDLPADPAIRDGIVADTTRRYLDMALDQAAVAMVVTWGLTDRFTYQNKDPEFRRKDGQTSRGLPFDVGLATTPMFASLQQSLSGALPR
jgi:endo-1,4-beta-xylanase